MADLGSRRRSRVYLGYRVLCSIGYRVAMTKLIVGRKAICQFLGNISWPTVLKWIRKKGLPVVQENGMPPTLLTSHAEAWQEKRLHKEKA